MKGFCRNDIICGIHLQRIKTKYSMAVCQWIFAVQQQIWCFWEHEKRKLVHGRRSDFCQESRSVYFLPVTNPASRAFSFLDENSALISHRRSGGGRSGFIIAGLFCTKIQDRRSSMQRAADRENRRPLEIFLTKIESPAHGNLLAAQPLDPKALTQTESSSWRKQNFRHKGLAAVLLDDIYTHVCRLNFLTKIAPVFARAARGGAVRDWLLEFGMPSSRLRVFLQSVR